MAALPMQRQLGGLGVLRGVVPWLLGGSEDPWLSVPAFRRVWLCPIKSLQLNRSPDRTVLYR